MTKDEDETKVEEVPPHETTAAPVNVSVATPHYFGVTPPMLLFGTATAALAVALALAILMQLYANRWIDLHRALAGAMAETSFVPRFMLRVVLRRFT